MKKFFVMIAVFVSVPFLLPAQSADYKVLFDLTSKDSLDHKAVIRWLTEVTNANPQARLEVVMYGQGYTMVLKDHSSVANDIARLAANKNVAFRVCEVALKNNHVDKSQLLPGVETVPDGIYEIISKQKQGWGYIKAVH
ncbi:MAG TPA: DsrE family protein [Chitinophagaceae bacterium]|jgi:intracellular sulfur oxidation DsrE/DsrF family protein|nr:DsrE family protein [Chitinophagaceae bacterium]